MKMNLYEYFDKNEIAEIVEYLKLTLDEEWVTEKDGVVTTNTPCELSNSELFDIASSWGERKSDKYHTQPESWMIERKYANMFKEACNEYFSVSHIHNDSIYFENIDFYGNPVKDEESDYVQVILKPTNARHLFNITTEYGKKVELDKQTKKATL